jgi:hypothetical protein
MNEWLTKKNNTRGVITTLVGAELKELYLTDLPVIHLQCHLPSGDWTNIIKVTNTMTSFASKCIPKPSQGIGVCIFKLSTCLNYGVEMNIRLSNTSQASIFVIFIPSTNECPIVQEFIPNL